MRISWENYRNGVSASDYREVVKQVNDGAPLQAPLIEDFREYRQNGKFDELLKELEWLSTDPWTGRYQEVYINGKLLDIASFMPNDMNLENGFKASSFKIEDIKQVAFLHFARNALNEKATYEDIMKGGDEKYDWLPDSKNKFHKFGLGHEDNFKVVSDDGHSEYIVRYKNGGYEVVDDPRNEGSYNFIPSSESFYGHYKIDVRPYQLFGNAVDDDTNLAQRDLIFGGAPSNLPERMLLNLNGKGDNSDNIIDLSVDDNDGRNVRNSIRAKDGDDLIISGKQDDVVRGGRGSDTISYEKSDSGVAVHLGQGFAHGGYASYDDEHEQFTSIENAIGSNHGDILVGSKGDNVFEGLAGNDKIFGGSGYDTARYDADSFDYNTYRNFDGSYDIVNLYTGETDTLHKVERLEFNNAITDMNLNELYDNENYQIVSNTDDYFSLG